MKTYYIYHVPGIKIGVTVRIKTRMREQGFESWEILEEHTDIYEASRREIELQREYGYLVDTEPYYVTIQKLNKNRSNGGSVSKPPTNLHLKRTLNPEDIIWIRNEYARIKNSSPIALKYNVSRGTILKIVKRQTYRDIA